MQQYPQQTQPPQQPPQQSFTQKVQALPIAAKIGAAAVAVVLVMCVCAGICSNGFGAGANSANTNQQTSQQQHSSATNTPAKPKTWVTVNHFTGHANGTKTFDVFHIQTGDHLVWSTTVHGSANLFMASLYNKGQSFGKDLPYQDITDTANGQSQSDTITIQTDSADVYLWVEADSVTWTVDIQRQQ